MPRFADFSHIFSILALSALVAFSLFVLAPSAFAAGGGTTGVTTGGGGTTGGTTGGGGTTGVTTGGGGTTGTNNIGLQNPLKNIDSLEDLLDAVLAAIIQLGTIILTLALVYTGFLFVMARGNPEEISKARGVLLWTVIGGLILLGAQGIKSVIFETAHDLTNGI